MPQSNPAADGQARPAYREGFAELAALGPVMLYAKNQMVYFQGEKADRFYYIQRGRVRIFLSSPNGTEKTLALREGGEVFGEAAFFDGLARVSSARTMEKSEIIPVGSPALITAFQQEPQLAMKLLRHLANNVRMLSAQLDAMAFLQAEKRIAQILVRLSSTKGDGSGTVCLTQEELGDLAGVTRVTASRALAKLRRLGLITTQYRIICLPDVGALDRYAQE